MNATRRLVLMLPVICISALAGVLLSGVCGEAAASAAAVYPAHQPGGKAPGTMRCGLSRASLPESRDAELNRSLERQQRFLQLTDDFLVEALAVTGRECADLEEEIDRIPLLDFPVREDDLRGLLESCTDYLYRLRELRKDIGGVRAELSSGAVPEESWWRDGYAELVRAQDEYDTRLAGAVAACEREERRLAGILERRRELEISVRSLDERLARIEENIRKLNDGSPGRAEKRKHADRMRSELTIVQNELLSLPLVDGGLLKHYAVLAERGRGGMELMSFRLPLAEAFRDTALHVGAGVPQRTAKMVSSYRGLAAECRRQAARMSRKIDEVYRKRSRVTPAGTLREMDRSRELADFYHELEGYFQSYKRYLSVLNAGLDYEIAASDAGTIR